MLDIDVPTTTLDHTIDSDLECHLDRLMDMIDGAKGAGVAASVRMGTVIELDGVEKRGERMKIVDEEMKGLVFTMKRMKCDF